MGVPAFLNPSNPRVMEFITKDLNSPIATLYQRTFGPIADPNLIHGGNNPTNVPAGQYIPPVSGNNSGGSGSSGGNTATSQMSGRGSNYNTLIPGSNNAVAPSLASASLPSFSGMGGFNTGLSPVQQALGRTRPLGGGRPLTFVQPLKSKYDAMGYPRTPISFAEGGMMTEGGGALRPGMPMQQGMPDGGPQLGADAPPPMDGRQLQQEAQNFVRSNPQVVQKIQLLISEGIRTGELTYDELNLAVQLAKAALANPAAYPQIRQFAIQNGLGSEAEIPTEYDQGILLVLLVVGQAMQAAGGSGTPAGQGPALGKQKGGMLPEYDDGGMTGDSEHLAVLHPREFVIPEDTLIYHGRKTFDRMIEQARTPQNG